VSLLEGTEVCFAPVLSAHEAPTHPHNAERGTFIDYGNGVVLPGPAPRFSRTPSEVRPSSHVGQHNDDVDTLWM
jgi:alpha-methylacyl-CoA racemase